MVPPIGSWPTTTHPSDDVWACHFKLEVILYSVDNFLDAEEATVVL